MNDVRTCESERTVFRFETQPRHLTDRWENVEVLIAHCEDCGKYAAVVVRDFDEAHMAGMWNAHHAHQMAQYIADHPSVDQSSLDMK